MSPDETTTLAEYWSSLRRRSRSQTLAMRVLERLGVGTFGQLPLVSERELFDLRGVNTKTVAEVVKLAAMIGVRLRPDTAVPCPHCQGTGRVPGWEQNERWGRALARHRAPA